MLNENVRKEILCEMSGKFGDSQMLEGKIYLGYYSHFGTKRLDCFVIDMGVSNSGFTKKGMESLAMGILEFIGSDEVKEGTGLYIKSIENQIECLETLKKEALNAIKERQE